MIIIIYPITMYKMQKKKIYIFLLDGVKCNLFLIVCLSLVCSSERKKEKEAEEEEDEREVFTVELQRGPRGLGLALVDGTVRVTGLFIQRSH